MNLMLHTRVSRKYSSDRVVKKYPRAKQSQRVRPSLPQNSASGFPSSIMSYDTGWRTLVFVPAPA